MPWKCSEIIYSSGFWARQLVNRIIFSIEYGRQVLVGVDGALHCWFTYPMWCEYPRYIYQNLSQLFRSLHDSISFYIKNTEILQFSVEAHRKWYKAKIIVEKGKNLPWAAEPQDPTQHLLAPHPLYLSFTTGHSSPQKQHRMRCWKASSSGVHIERTEYKTASRIPLNESIRNWKNPMGKAVRRRWFELGSFRLGNF